MPTPQLSVGSQPRFDFWLLCVFLIILWIAGGSARADALGQSVVRFAAWAVLSFHVLLASDLTAKGAHAPLAILLAAIALVVVQLVPLPPSLWMALPGREPFTTPAELLGVPQPWRPLAISPSQAVNALQSLVVPFAVLWLAKGLRRSDQWLVFTLTIGLMVAGTAVGLLQLLSASVDNPFINENAGFVSGNFANRNHFALFTALACLFLPIWVFRKGAGWGRLVGLALLPLLILSNLSTGSRAGLLLGAVAVIAGFASVRAEAAAAYVQLPLKRLRWLAIAGTLLVLGLVGAAIILGRAQSIDRIFALDASQDLRAQSRPVVLALISRYFPFGSGFGGFDPIYRMAEPDRLLQMNYLNHAHNDWLEVALEGGILAILLVAAAVVWWLKASRRAWKKGEKGDTLARAGSGAIFLIIAASLTDYPARTPMMMAILALAATWLGNASATSGKRAAASRFQLPEPLSRPAADSKASRKNQQLYLPRPVPYQADDFRGASSVHV